MTCVPYPDQRSLLPRPPAILTSDPQMRSLISRATTVARSKAAVLLVGETGVGKELFAEHIHCMSPRGDRPFVAVALSAMPPDLVETELFGHERGAFTSAHAEKKGLFELANGGTIFLDDIDDVPLAAQVKLLRVLETEQVQRLGAVAPIPIDVRLVSSSKLDLRPLIERNLFRSDLYYRINVCPLQIPPLRHRVGDVPLLIDHFLRRFASERMPMLAPDAESALKSYEWPGNIRELRNVVHCMALFGGETIHVSDLPPEIAIPARPGRSVEGCSECPRTRGLPFSEVVECLERHLLRRAMMESGGNSSRAARALGLSLSTLRDKLHRLHIGTVDQR